MKRLVVYWGALLSSSSQSGRQKVTEFKAKPRLCVPLLIVTLKRTRARGWRANGLPPLAVERAQAAKETEQFWQELERTRVEDEANARAAELQAQIGALSNQLNYLQATAGERSAFASGAFGGLGGVSSFRSSGRTIIRAPLFGPRFGLPLDVDFVTLNGPFGSRPRFNALRRNVFVPGVPVRGGVTFGHVPLMPRRFR